MKPQAAVTTAAAVVISIAAVVIAAEPEPVAFSASEWLGIDGNWSTYSFLVGENNNVNVLFSTSLSEFWAVGPGGCGKSDPHCSTARGGIYYPSESKHWSGLGTWELGLPDLGTGGNGQYGFDTISARSSITNAAFGMSNVLISAINSTGYYLGYFGVGLRSGNFGDIVASPPMRQAVASFGCIPSYSYGYTAGASYRGIVGSATLGGYDSTRLVMHDNTFNMNQTEGVPRPLVRGIEVHSNNSNGKPAGWDSATQVLLEYSQAFTAVIDTTTPYLWLPPSVCDHFAQALNLVYNDTFDLYTLTNDQYRQYSSNSSLEFTFSLSSLDNRDNFGLPLNVNGVVNITVSIQAFVSLLQYPFGKGAIAYGAPAVPYFTLRKSPNNNFIIGNAFMQEAYVITKYDSGTFSVHQAQFPSNPIGGAQLQKIIQPPNSPYPPPLDPNANGGLSTGDMVGIAVGAVAFFSLSVLAFFCFRRHRRQQRAASTDMLENGKDSASILTPDALSPVSRMFSRIVGRKRSRHNGLAMIANAGNPSEAPDHQIYELSAPLPPAELDAGSADGHSVYGDTDIGTDSTQQLSAYEIARRKLDRQLAGPVPEYSPPTDSSILRPEKAALPELQPVGPQHTNDQPSPVSPTRSNAAESSTNSNTLLTSDPSPVSPRAEWSSAELPSPVTASMATESNSSGSRGGGQNNTSRSLSTNSNNPVSPLTDTMPTLPAPLQRAPIDPSRVVCLGPLPANIQLPAHGVKTAPEAVGSGDERNVPAITLLAASRLSEVSLGSNFTDDEEMERQAGQDRAGMKPVNNEATSSRLGQDKSCQPEKFDGDQTPSGSNDCASNTASGGESRTQGLDLDFIHVPQMAAKRYSWEDDR